MSIEQQFVFVKKIAHAGKRVSFTVPPEVAELLHPEQKYEVILRPVGTLVVTKV